MAYESQITFYYLHRQRVRNDDYTGYRVGAAVDVHGFVFDMSYHGTTDDDDAEEALNVVGTDWTDSRFVLTLSTSFLKIDSQHRAVRRPGL